MELNHEVLKDTLREVIDEEIGIKRLPEIARKWDGGTLILKPADTAQQSKEVPLDVYFKKLTGVRERLRVLEQKLNNHPTLTNTEKVEFQEYITRCYGALTTFNVLFRDEEDRFIGQKGE
jgi:hypothetical protein